MAKYHTLLILFFVIVFNVLNNLYNNRNFIYFIFTEQSDREIILNAFKYLMEKTKVNGNDCIKLIPRTNQIDYVNIVNKDGCWSYVI